MRPRNDASLTAEHLREILNYDPATGVFTWKVNVRRVPVGSVAGRLNTDGYWRIGINGRQYPAHRLAWLYMHGEWPSTILDHEDDDRSNNRIKNLRPATQSLNVANRRINKEGCTSQYRGVSLVRLTGKWAAFIKVDGKSRRIGDYDSEFQAHQAYVKAARDAFGEFARVA